MHLAEKLPLNYRTLLLTVFIFVTSLGAAQPVTYDKTPAWVVPFEMEPETQPSDKIRSDIAEGYYTAYSESHYNLEMNAVYHQNIQNVISYGGITNASQLLVEYDSSYQNVVIHHLYIWRKGVKIDRTAELSFERLNHESNLSNGMYYGISQAYDILNDIRKDDLIDFAYTVIGENPIYGETENLMLILQEIMKPIGQLNVRVIYDKNKEFNYRCSKCDSLQITSRIEGDNMIIDITGKNLKPVTNEEQLPPWSTPFAYFMLSGFNNWSEVNAWAQEVFRIDTQPALDIVYNEILTGNENTDQKINKFIDYVQDEIRYMGVESGIGSIKPRNPEITAKQRFGDCKDKSMLLVSLLKQSGIDKAWPVLVNSMMNKETQNFLPGNRLFNHCIVKFEYNDSVFWVDPTWFLQGGNFRNMYTPDYGRVLVIGQPTDTLTIMNPRKPESTYSVTYLFDSPTFDEPVTLTCTSVRTGEAADVRRAMSGLISSKDMIEGFMKDLRINFPSVELEKEPDFVDDPVKNEFRIIHHYKIPEFWIDAKKRGDMNFDFYSFAMEPVDIHQQLATVPCTPREYDLYVEHPVEYNYKFIFNCPQSLHFLDAWTQFETAAYTYEENFVQLAPKKIQAEYIYKSKAHQITPEEFDELCKTKKKILDGLRFSIVLQK